MYGILQPLTVTRKEIQTKDGAFFTQYELIAGERRLRASRLAGMEQVPVIIRTGENSEQEKLELAIIENLQREDLNAVDRALAFRQLADVFNLPHAAVAKKVGRSREYVSNTIRLLGLPDYMLSSLRTADISEGHARTLLMLNDKPEEQDVIFREILLKKLSVREVERIVRKIASDKVRKKNWANTDAVLIEIEREFTDTLGTRVQILKTDFGGKLTIDYFSDEDLQKLLAIMKSQGKITDFHMAGGEEESSTTHIQELEKITDATVLELVEPQPERVEDEIRVEDALEAEQAVREELENVIAENAEFAGLSNATQEPSRDGTQRHALDTNEVHTSYQEGSETQAQMQEREDMKVPPSGYVAYERPVVEEEAYGTSYTTYPVVSNAVMQPQSSNGTDQNGDGMQDALKANMQKLNNEAKAEAPSFEGTDFLTPRATNFEQKIEPVIVMQEVVQSEPIQQAVVTETKEPTPAKKDDDDDLYSMKNFGL